MPGYPSLTSILQFGLTAAKPQAVCPPYFCLVLTPTLIWPVKERMDAQALRINRAQQELFVPLQ